MGWSRRIPRVYCKQLVLVLTEGTAVMETLFELPRLTESGQPMGDEPTANPTAGRRRPSSRLAEGLHCASDLW